MTIAPTGTTLDQQCIPVISARYQYKDKTDHFRSLYSSRGPHIPSKPDPISVLILSDVVLPGRHIENFSTIQIRGFPFYSPYNNKSALLLECYDVSMHTSVVTVNVFISCHVLYHQLLMYVTCQWLNWSKRKRMKEKILAS